MKSEATSRVAMVTTSDATRPVEAQSGGLGSKSNVISRQDRKPAISSLKRAETIEVIVQFRTIILI